MSSTDHQVPGPDEAGGEPDPAASPSRARLARYGWVPWAVGVAVAAAQMVVLVAAPGRWRTEGVAGLIVVTLAGVAFAVFGADE